MSYTHISGSGLLVLIALWVLMAAGLAVALWRSTYEAAADLLARRRKDPLDDYGTGVNHTV